MIKNPIKFVKLFNSKSGTEQIVPLSTYERLSQESPKTMKNIQFICNCDEDGNKIEAAPVVEKLKPVLDAVKEDKAETANNKKEAATKPEEDKKPVNKKPVVTPLENGK